MLTNLRTKKMVKRMTTSMRTSMTFNKQLIRLCSTMIKSKLSRKKTRSNLSKIRLTSSVRTRPCKTRSKVKRTSRTSRSKRKRIKSVKRMRRVMISSLTYPSSFRKDKNRSRLRKNNRRSSISSRRKIRTSSKLISPRWHLMKKRKVSVPNNSSLTRT